MTEINPLVERAIDAVGPSVVVEFFIHTASVIHELYKTEIEADRHAATSAEGSI